MLLLSKRCQTKCYLGNRLFQAVFSLQVFVSSRGGWVWVDGEVEQGAVLPDHHLRHRRPAQRHRLLLLPRRRIPKSQGEGHEAGRQPLLPAQELRLRIGRRGHRLPLRGAAGGHHGGGDHHVRRLQAQQAVHRQAPRGVRRHPRPLLGELRAGRRPASDRGEHEPRAALRPGLDGRRLLRRQERRVRRGRRAGRRHGAPHPRPHLRHQIILMRHHSSIRHPRHNDHPSRRGRGHPEAERAIQAMTTRTGRANRRRGGRYAALFVPQRPSRVGPSPLAGKGQRPEPPVGLMMGGGGYTGGLDILDGQRHIALLTKLLTTTVQNVNETRLNRSMQRK